MKVTSNLNALAIAIVTCGFLTCSLCILAFHSFALPLPVNEGLTFQSYLEYARHIYYALYEFRAPIMLLLALLPFIALWGTHRCLTSTALAQRVLTLSCAIIGVYLIFSAAAYSMSPSFFDHIESSIAALSILGLAGKPVIYPLDSPDVLNMFYGPSVHLANMPFLCVINDPITACKTRGFACLLLTLATMAWLHFRHFSSHNALFNLLVFLATLLLFSFFSFGNRADSLLLVAATLVCLGSVQQKKKSAVLLLSLGTSLLIHGKFHALIYVIPPLIHILASRGIRFLLPAIPLTCILLALPFLWSGTFSISNYLSFITTPTETPFNFATACENFAFATLILSPLVALRWLMSKTTDKIPNRPVSYAFWALIICVSGECIVASMAGSWYYHLMAFLPAISLLQGQTAESIDIRSFGDEENKSLKCLCTGLLIAWLLTALTSGFRHQLQVLHNIANNSINEVRKDLAHIQQSNPDKLMAMGYGNRYSDSHVNLRPLVVKESQSLYFDHNTYSHYILSGNEIEEPAYARIREKHYDIFLIPKDQEPFSDPLFHSSRYREFFLDNYHFDKAGRYFELWRPKIHDRGHSDESKD